MKANPIETAPKDGTLLRLLVDYQETGASFEDSSEPTWTIGFNNLDNTGIDLWQVAGWDWCHDVITEATEVRPLAWLELV